MDRKQGHPRFSAEKRTVAIHEVVICAAVKTTCGQIIRGHRHDSCIREIEFLGLKVSIDLDAEGFMTSKNRYVDRAEARRIQDEAGIGSANGEFLFEYYLTSEDLY